MHPVMIITATVQLTFIKPIYKKKQTVKYKISDIVHPTSEACIIYLTTFTFDIVGYRLTRGTCHS